MVEETDKAGPRHDEEEDDDEEDSDAASTSTAGGSASAAGGKKKKKKNKKKKKQGGAVDASQQGDGPDASTNSASTSTGGNSNIKAKVDKGEADRRFNAALDGARKGDLWVDLSSTALQPAKAKKLFDALKGNDSVTSVDLSGNNIGDEGAQAIAAVLGTNGVPALIELDLRDNPLSDEGLKALEGLRKIRKKLLVKTGSSKAPEPAPSASGSKELIKGKMFRKFFQTGDDDDDDGSLSHQESTLDDRGVNPQELWEEIKAKQRAGALAALGTKLQQLCGLLHREVQVIQSASSNVLDGSKPHVKECVANLSVLHSVLSMQPRKLILQGSPELLSAVGSHRVAAAEAVVHLAAPNNVLLDRAVLGSNLVPEVLSLALQHPLCSTLHVRSLQLLRNCLSSTVPDLALGLMQPGWGIGLQAWRTAVGGSTNLAPEEGEEPEGQCSPFPEVLVSIASSAVSVPSGSRSPIMGFVLELCKALREAGSPADGGKRNEAVAKALQANKAWSAFASGSGPLSTLVSEQAGDLCGPRPVRPPMDEASELGGDLEGGATGHMSGREILALLQSMSAMGVMS